MKHPEIAKTILRQLGGGRLVMMTGAKNLLDHGNGLSFKFPNRTRSKPNYCKVILDPSDTYTVTFGRVTKYGELKNEKTVEGVYCDMLVDLFERETGLYLTL